MGALLGDRLDRYLGRSVAGAWLAALLFMVLLVSLIDLLLHLGGYLRGADERGAGTLGLLVDLAAFYALSVPLTFVMVAPFVTVIAAMFTVSAFFSTNEIAPMLFCGRSILRVLRPVLLVAVTSALLMAACWEWVIPATNETWTAMSKRLDADESVEQSKNVVLKVREAGVDQTLLVTRYDHAARRMSGVTLVDRGSGPHDVVTVVASEAVWDPAREDWALTDGERLVPGRGTPQPWLAVPSATPDLITRLGKEGKETLQLSYSELLDLRALRPGRRDLVMAFHAHLTFPLANLVLLLLALPFAISYERGRRIERVVFAVLVCGLYLVTDLSCQSLGLATLHPVLAAWLPTIVFGAFGSVFFAGMRS